MSIPFPSCSHILPCIQMKKVHIFLATRVAILNAHQYSGPGQFLRGRWTLIVYVYRVFLMYRQFLYCGWTADV